MVSQLTNYLKAGYTGLWIVSHEEQRVAQDVLEACKAAKRRCLHWDVNNGFSAADGKACPKGGAGDPNAALSLLHSEDTTLILWDFQLWLKDPGPGLVRAFQQAFALGKGGKGHSCAYIVVAPYVKLPPELEKQFQVVDFCLPDRARLAGIVQEIAASGGLTVDDPAPLLDAASGLTTQEAADALALSFVESKGQKLDPKVVSREKATTLKKNGLLRVVETKVKLDDIGGLGSLKTWVCDRRHAFTPEARAWGLPNPRGFLLLGIPGCGKSLVAEATSSILGVPLLKLDAGSLFGSLVGQSEANTRAVIQTAEAVAPCVLWIDELDKGFGGQGGQDGGTSERVIGTLLDWMDKKTAPVLVVATANDVSKLKPEFLRKGRFDEQWFVDLPTAREREDIWRVVTRKKGRTDCYTETELARLVSQTEGFSGAEIEAAFSEALYATYNLSPRPFHPPLDLMITVIMGTTPLSKMMAEQIKSLREWCHHRAKPATTPETLAAPATGKRKLLAS